MQRAVDDRGLGSSSPRRAAGRGMGTVSVPSSASAGQNEEPESEVARIDPCQGLE